LSADELGDLAERLAASSDPAEIIEIRNDAWILRI
jgi:hypothetical protein